jgi:hypothetical protein
MRLVKNYNTDNIVEVKVKVMLRPTVSLWCQVPILDLRPFFFFLIVAGLLMWGALSDERPFLSFTMYNVLYIYILHVIT